MKKERKIFMKKIFGKIIMEQIELDRIKLNARIQGMREAQKTLSQDKRNIMINCGFFPVTADFWTAIGKPEALGPGFDWAYFEPEGKKQKFMPFHGWLFLDMTGFEIRHEAEKARKILRGEY